MYSQVAQIRLYKEQSCVFVKLQIICVPNLLLLILLKIIVQEEIPLTHLLFLSLKIILAWKPC